MNTEQIRQSVREKWLTYYAENRQWLSRLGVWVNCDGQRRPSSGFILATLSVLEPRLAQLLPLVVDLSSNPDRIVMALGLNFNPEEQLDKVSEGAVNETTNGSRKLLPAALHEINIQASQVPMKAPAQIDEDCRGSRDRRD
ncbi:hypothetical protein C7B82_26015 [Stenomitos frigidus ULC18]|uniref:DUF5331 domain-containing protein n=1 Tax=Stenomitos frigidus ULC18 TaxID=2107698 RepID=A0A2T1DWN0_9CYAN|nr:hypothetical protein C7B82_26015 [Stenomitos frigidus ULC18]